MVTGAHRGFTRGSSTYQCEICKRRTRLTTSDDTRFCGECYDLLGMQNTLWDDGEDQFIKDGFLAERDNLLKVIVSRGGNEAAVKHDMTDLFAVKVPA